MWNFFRDGWKAWCKSNSVTCPRIGATASDSHRKYISLVMVLNTYSHMLERLSLFLWTKENIIIIILIYCIVENERIINTSICWYKITYLTNHSIQVLNNEEIWDFHFWTNINSSPVFIRILITCTWTQCLWYNLDYIICIDCTFVVLHMALILNLWFGHTACVLFHTDTKLLL
jgi:hypothetical protein